MSQPIPEEQQKKFFGRNYYCVYFVNNMVDHNFHGICTVPLPNSTAKQEMSKAKNHIESQKWHHSFCNIFFSEELNVSQVFL